MRSHQDQDHIKLISLMVREDGDYFEIDNITRTGFEVTFRNTANDSSYARSFIWGASGFGNQVSV